MDTLIGNILNSGGHFYLAGLLAASFFFGMIGLRFLKQELFEGLIFVAVAFFFFVANIILVLTESNGMVLSLTGLLETALYWIVFIMGPAVIMLFIILGLYNLLKFEISESLCKIFLGIFLIMILFTVGFNWPELLKAGLVITFLFFWFSFELKDSREY